jgi:hypothetical protein
MNTAVQKLLANVVTLALLAIADNPAFAQKRTSQSEPVFTGGIGPSNGQVAAVAAGIAGAGAAIGIGVFYAVHHGHSLTGCAATGSNGLELVSEGDQKTWALVGEVNDIKPGKRIRVAGKKELKDSANSRQFLVEKVSKDFGLCDGGRSTR